MPTKSGRKARQAPKKPQEAVQRVTESCIPLDDTELDDASSEINAFRPSLDRFATILSKYSKLLEAYKTLLKAYKRLSATSTKQPRQQEDSEPSERFVQLLVDAQDFVFDKKLIRQGFKGGEEAASDLFRSTREYFYWTAFPKSKIRICVVVHYSKLARRLKMYQTTIANFANGLRCVGKETVVKGDDNFRKTLHQCVGDLQCKQIFFLACRGNRFAKDLAQYSGKTAKISLVRVDGLPVHQDFSGLSFETVNFSSTCFESDMHPLHDSPTIVNEPSPAHTSARKAETPAAILQQLLEPGSHGIEHEGPRVGKPLQADGGSAHALHLLNLLTTQPKVQVDPPHSPSEEQIFNQSETAAEEVLVKNEPSLGDTAPKDEDAENAPHPGNETQVEKRSSEEAPPEKDRHENLEDARLCDSRAQVQAEEEEGDARIHSQDEALIGGTTANEHEAPKKHHSDMESYLEEQCLNGEIQKHLESIMQGAMAIPDSQPTEADEKPPGDDERQHSQDSVVTRKSSSRSQRDETVGRILIPRYIPDDGWQIVGREASNGSTRQFSGVAPKETIIDESHVVIEDSDDMKEQVWHCDAAQLEDGRSLAEIVPSSEGSKEGVLRTSSERYEGPEKGSFKKESTEDVDDTPGSVAVSDPWRFELSSAAKTLLGINTSVVQKGPAEEHPHERPRSSSSSIHDRAPSIRQARPSIEPFVLVRLSSPQPTSPR